MSPSTPASPSGSPPPSSASSSDAFKYWAFISYSSRDREWGDWLHRALERYRVPKALADRKTARGYRVPKRLFPVFRDRDELPTDADLNGMIQRALEQSRYLIVICSPRSARSRWVNQEILAFKRLGRESHVFAFIVDGSPYASETPGRDPEEECLPAALRRKLGADGALTTERLHPIAADAREKGDGRQNALLKMIAGVLGVNYDDLKCRDEEYQRARLRKLQVAAATFATLAVFASAAAFLAWRGQGAVAQRTVTEMREQAEVKPLIARGDELAARVDTHRGTRLRLVASAQFVIQTAHEATRAITGGFSTETKAVDSAIKTLEGLAPKIESHLERVPGLLLDARPLTREAVASLLSAVQPQIAALDERVKDAQGLGDYPVLTVALGNASRQKEALQQAEAELLAASARVLPALQDFPRDVGRFLGIQRSLHAKIGAAHEARRGLAADEKSFAVEAQDWSAAENSYEARKGSLDEALKRSREARDQWREAKILWERYLASFDERMKGRGLLERIAQTALAEIKDGNMAMVERFNGQGGLKSIDVLQADGGVMISNRDPRDVVVTHDPVPQDPAEQRARAAARRIYEQLEKITALKDEIRAARTAWEQWSERHAEWKSEAQKMGDETSRALAEWNEVAASNLQFRDAILAPQRATLRRAREALGAAQTEVAGFEQTVTNDAKTLAACAQEIFALVRVLPPGPFGEQISLARQLEGAAQPARAAADDAETKK